MACHEIAALRLGMMNLVGIDDPAERAHELAELGPAATEPGPLAAMLTAPSLQQLGALFSLSLGELNEKVARTGADDPKLGYWRTLLVLTKKVELELRGHHEALTRLFHELEEMHDLVHELYPAGDEATR